VLSGTSLLIYKLNKFKAMNSGKLFLGLLAGVAAGALLGVLFAPDKGASTRKKITKKSEDYVDSLKEKFNEFLDTIGEKVDEAKEDVEKVKAKAESIKKDVKAATS
jgi:gas vesicle protein